jgi:hypothetical protein
MTERSGLENPAVQCIEWIVTGKVAPATPREEIVE